MARYERLPDGSFCLTKYNCTLKRISAQFPQICQQEQAWFSEALGVSVEMTRSRVKGALQCTFRIEAKGVP
jgi:predicted ArsR family transcriptional regulator